MFGIYTTPVETPPAAIYEIQADLHVVYEGYISGWTREGDEGDWEPETSTNPPYRSATLPSRGDEMGWLAKSGTFMGQPIILPEIVFGPDSSLNIPEGTIGYTIPSNIPVYINSYHPACAAEGMLCDIVGTEPVPNLDSPLINSYPDFSLLNMQTSVVFKQNDDLSWDVYDPDTGVRGRSMGTVYVPPEA